MTSDIIKGALFVLIGGFLGFVLIRAAINDAKRHDDSDHDWSQND